MNKNHVMNKNRDEAANLYSWREAANLYSWRIEDRFAVLQVDKLSVGDVAFGSNSWRGDRYAGEVRKLIEKKEKSQ